MGELGFSDFVATYVAKMPSPSASIIPVAVKFVEVVLTEYDPRTFPSGDQPIVEKPPDADRIHSWACFDGDG